ncbi:flagellar hook assembly protein FlgD [Ramlibacter alkalitolerans]|uniref:Basal-body rod modification protein FlgD n=1 Tax=Ramlibacter alkalitolerans TaxID=2039631 RepID=A0ABS1JT24_9BURK|nr:flagellar hook capping FlgD N-terminal domain-containing protein [Ramlibacter alkalitolerans]MBL0427387.1 flagellar hook capping protein [Ramlibacter alkalitolerans]
MAIGSIAAPAAGAASSALGLQDFMKVLLTQLTFQDPLKPMDNQAFMAQMAQFTALDQTQQLNQRVQQMLENEAALQSVGLLGRSVDVESNGVRNTGTVSAMALQGDAPLLTVTLPGGGVLNDVSLSQLTAIR